MRKLTRREIIKLAALAGAVGLLPRPVQAISSFGASKLEEFLKKVTGTGTYTSQADWEKPPDTKHKFAMVIDLGLCIGCRRCSYACKLENNVPDTISPPYIMLFEYDKTGFNEFARTPETFENKNRLNYTRLRKDKVYMPVQCNHCDDAPCATVCPTGASYKAIDGIVMVDCCRCGFADLIETPRISAVMNREHSSVRRTTRAREAAAANKNTGNSNAIPNARMNRMAKPR